MPQEKQEVTETTNESPDNQKSEQKDMPRFELRNIPDLFWSSSSTKEEKTPIVKNSTRVPDSGSLKNGSNMNGGLDSKSTCDSLIGAAADSAEDDDSSDPPKMTLLRKLCFFLSLNGGVAYVAALLWFIPCHHPLCLNMKNWTVNISGKLTTNMEIKSTLLSSSMLFGIANVDGGKLSSLTLANGTMVWNKGTNNILKNVFCDMDSFNQNTGKIPGCIVTAHNYIAAFDASNGTMMWERAITDSSDIDIHKVVLAGKHSTDPTIFAVSDEEFFLLVAKNGTLVSKIDLPCSWTVGVNLVGPLPTVNETSWALVCDYGDSLEVWTFLEQEVLNLPEDFDEGPFRLVFSRDNGNNEAIDLAGDFTRTPNSLALSWADSVVMVTHQSLSYHPQKLWERRFNTSSVTSIVYGRFTNSKEHQIAVAVQDGSNTILHILDHEKGTSGVVTNLGKCSVTSMNRIRNGERNVDTLIIESISPNEKKNMSSNSESSSMKKEYFSVKYAKKIAIREHILTAEVQASTFSQFTEGAANLLIARQSSDLNTIVNRYVLISKMEDQCG